MSKWVQGKVIEQKEWAPGLFSLYIEATIAPFTAGQFTQLSLDDGESKLFRPYSFANAPTEPHLEFYYDVIEQGHLTPQLQKLSPGDFIWVGQKAAGRFILSEVPAGQDLWLFATGTGFGVFLSLLKTPEAWERFQNIIFIHSVRYAHSLTHQHLIQGWQEQYGERFRWVPVVTREKIPHMQSERIGALIESGQLEALQQLSFSSQTSQAMLCGNPAMVAEISTLLQTKGLQMNRIRQPGNITVENYWKL